MRRPNLNRKHNPEIEDPERIKARECTILANLQDALAVAQGRDRAAIRAMIRRRVAQVPATDGNINKDYLILR